VSDPPVVYTASWRAAISAEPALQPVRVSLGKPKWIPPAQADAYPAIESLMPSGLLNADLGRDEFEARFRHALDRRAPAIESAVTALLGRVDRSVAMACFELRPEDCHRSIAGAWLEDRFGLNVAEWHPEPDPQLTLPTEEER
jgi:hypothetical protein